jgi:electron transfer flavoprotein alpha subunit
LPLELFAKPPRALKEVMDMAKGVWIVAEQRDGAFRKISFELAATARKLADQLGEEVCAVLCGSGIEGIAGEIRGR